MLCSTKHRNIEYTPNQLIIAQKLTLSINTTKLIALTPQNAQRIGAGAGAGVKLQLSKQIFGGGSALNVSGSTILLAQ